MKNIRYILLISACSLLPNEGQAEINLTFDISNIALSNPTLHTHHTPVVLKPIWHMNNGANFYNSKDTYYYVRAVVAF